MIGCERLMLGCGVATGADHDSAGFDEVLMGVPNNAGFLRTDWTPILGVEEQDHGSLARIIT